MLTVGIETSCDETAVAVTDGWRVLSSEITSSVHLHAQYGGIVPEIASRHHVEYINDVLRAALARAKKKLGDVRLIAVTRGPGLVGALLVGVSMAKGLSFALRVPFIGVNHIIAHLYSAFLGRKSLPRFPFIGLAVSGGHTSIYLCRDFDRVRVLGQTQDDAVGEAYDKVAKVLGLGYPGGPLIERMAAEAKGDFPVRFARTYLAEGSLDFSFSGIKTAVLNHTRSGDGRRALAGRERSGYAADVCRAFQDSVLEVVVDKVILACGRHRLNTLVVGGGVSANGALRERLGLAASRHGIDLLFPEKRFCGDNGAMIGPLGEELYRRGARSSLSMTAQASLSK